jgi:hypothetical protein
VVEQAWWRQAAIAWPGALNETTRLSAGAGATTTGTPKRWLCGDDERRATAVNRSHEILVRADPGEIAKYIRGGRSRASSRRCSAGPLRRVTSCSSSNRRSWSRGACPSSWGDPMERSAGGLALATERYRGGDLTGALAMLRVTIDESRARLRAGPSSHPEGRVAS